MRKSILALTLVLLTVAGIAAAAPDYYATKADERAGKLTPGQPPRSAGPIPNAGGDTCASATVIAATPYADTGDTTGAGNDVSSIPPGCSNYTTVAGPDHIYVFTAGAGGASLSFSVTPDATWDPSIYVLGTCGTTASCLFGSDAGVLGDAETIATQSYAAGLHAVYVDSFYAIGDASADGPYTFNATGTLPVELMGISVD